jgi:hypothetical protein
MRRVRLVTFAWGEAYVGELLEFALPALLAPGNLPALAAKFRCELVFLTERRLFARVEAHPSFRRVREICEARLVEIDDLLVAPLYGLSLTYASYRAFEDLGEEVTQTALLYFNSDWILADGSYRSLIPHIEAGARLVVAPSYCVVSERALPPIRARLAEGQGVLSMAHREMAGLAIRYRHNTIRGKTVNQRVFHMNVMDQLYWRADERTLLCHQMPIAVVCISPERFVPKPEAFWDYGVVSELCPTSTPVVLGDSDEFLMIELRSEETYAEGLRIGWPDLPSVGRHLATFVTKDHLDYGRFQLCLHSGDLPPGLDEPRAKLRQALEEVYAQIPAPQDHRGHPFWWPQKTLFDIVRREHAARDVVREWRWGYRASPYTNMIKAEIERLDRELERSGTPPDVDRILTGLGACVGQLEGLFGGDVHSLRKALLTRSHRWRRHAKATPSSAPRPVSSDETPPAGMVRRLLRSLRSRVNAPHRLHPDRLVAQDLLAELDGEDRSGSSLVICSAGHDLAVRALRMLGRRASLVASEDALEFALEPGATWRLLVCDLAHDELESFRPILRRLLPVMEDGGKVLVFHPSRRGRLQMDAWTLLNAFPPSDRLRVRYAGSRWSHLATGVYDRTVRVLPRVALAGFNLAPFAALALAAPLTALGALQEPGGDNPPPSCASMLLSLPVSPEVRRELDGW